MLCATASALPRHLRFVVPARRPAHHRGTVLEVNQTALNFAGLSREDVVGRSICDPILFLREPVRQRITQAVNDAATGRFVRYEEDYRRFDSEMEAFDFSIKPVHDELGCVVLLIAEARPITEQKKAAEASAERGAVPRGVRRRPPSAWPWSLPTAAGSRSTRSLCQIVGYTEEELLEIRSRTSPTPRTVSADLELVRKRLRRRDLRRIRWRSGMSTRTATSSGSS